MPIRRAVLDLHRNVEWVSKQRHFHYLKQLSFCLVWQEVTGETTRKLNCFTVTKLTRRTRITHIETP